MKKLFVCAMLMGLVLPAIAADIIVYKGDSKDSKDAVCYYNNGNFYADAARKQFLFRHPGGIASTDKKGSNKAAVYRFTGGKIYKGNSIKKQDCLATIVVSKTQKGYTKDAKIYDGWALVREKKERFDKGGITVVMSQKVTADGKSAPAGKVLYTISGNKIYKGDSTDPKDCVLSYTGDLDSARLLFIAFQFTK